MKRKKLNVEYKRDFNKKVKLRSAKTEKFYYTSTEKNTSIIIFLSVDNFTRGHIMRNSDFSKKIWEASILCDISSNIYYKFLVDGIEKIDKTQKYIEVIPGEIFNIKNVKEKTVKSEVLSDNVIIIDESDDDVSILSQKKFNISSVVEKLNVNSTKNCNYKYLNDKKELKGSKDFGVIIIKENSVVTSLPLLEKDKISGISESVGTFAQEVGAAANDLSLSAFLKETAKDHLIKEGDLTCKNLKFDVMESFRFSSAIFIKKSKFQNLHFVSNKFCFLTHLLSAKNFECKDCFIKFSLNNLNDLNNYYERLKNPLKFNNTEFVFFGATKSQMESKSCFLVKRNSFEYFNSTFKLNGLSPSKKSKILGFLLNEFDNIVVSNSVNIILIEDIKINNFNFTEGCGFISLDLAAEFFKNSLRKKNSNLKNFPSLFQVRLPGVKGVLLINKYLPLRTIHIRKSMIKINLLRFVKSPTNPNFFPTLPYYVISTSKPFISNHFLNSQALYLLIKRGVSTEFIHNHSLIYLNSLQGAFLDIEHCLNYLHLTGRKSELDEIAVCILKKSVNLRDLKRMWRNILNSQFSDICSWSKPATNFKEFDNDFNAADHQSLRVRIPVASSLLFGTAEPPLTDGKKLSYNQCFVNIMRDGENVVILGKVAILRNPCYHPGDIIILDAVNVPEFSHISDVIIFPTQGPVPHAYQASGGDLDGDKFLVIWDQNFIPKTSVKSFDYNTTVMRNTIYNAFKRRNIPVIPTKPCETDLDFFISSKPFERVGKIDSLIRKYQLSLQAESEAESDETLMLLNTIFNLGVDDEEGIPEIDTLLSVLEREINLKSSSKLSTFGELENWFLKELKSCKRIFEERFELFYLTDVFWDTFKQSVVKLRLKFKEKTNILDNLPFKREFESEVKSLHIIEMEKIQNFRKNVEYDFDISSCNFNNLHQRLFYEIKLKFGAQRLFNIQQVFQEIIFEKIFVKIKSFGVCNGINNCNVKETFTTDRMVQLEKNFKSFILAYKNDAVKGKMFSKNEKKLDCISWKSTDITSYSSSSTISNISQLEESERYIECLLKREANFLKFLNNILHCDEKRLAHSSIHEVGRVVDVEVELIKRASTTLAIYDYGRDIVESIKKFNLTILISDTGSGKSHCIPQILLNEKIITSENTSMKPIIVAQPMRNAAASLANYSKEFRNTKLGEEVGYNLGGERTVANKLVTQLIYVTHGILLGQCTSNSSFSQYSVIFVDECHELSSQLFLLLSYLKRALVFNKELRVVLMSASLKERSLVDFFGECNVIKCRNKRGYPVETVFMDRPFNTNIVDACVDVASNLHKTKTSKLPSTMYEDILVFLPTSRDIETACSQMRKLKLENLAILPFYSSLPEEIKKSVISNSVNRNYRRVIFATNIAETSITFSNLGYIVDSGLQFQVKECLVTGIKNRNVVNISQSSHLQRKGRVGRTHAGTMFCLYSKDDLDNFKKEYDPEFENLEITILRMVKCNIDFYNFQWYKTPTEKEISHTVEQLLDLDMLEKRNDIFSCTLFGEILLETACLGFEAKHLLMLIYSIDLNCFDECLTILSFLIYQKPFKLRDANDQVFNCVHEIDRNLIVDLTYDEEEEEILLIPNPFVKYSSSMLLCISHDYHEYLTNINSEQKKKFCTDNNLCYNAMKYISKIKNKCKKVLKTIDFEQKVKKILVLNEEKKQLEFNLNNLKFKPVNAASPMLERLRFVKELGRFYKNLCVFNYDESHSRNDLVVTLMFKRKNFKYAVIAKSEENFFNFKKPFHDYVEEESTDYITGRYVFYCFTNITCISNKLIVSGLEHIPSIFLSAGTYGLPERFRKMFEELFLNY